ncbi:MAG: hypothetical protein JKY19_05465 [Alcanivoracaceae bacterium]|nr:hypothetical protein [Alcanivoracaceae bacterium]
MIKVIVAFVCINFSWLVAAVEITELNPIEKISIKSKVFEEPIEFNITLPASYDKAKDKRYFLIFDLHPRSQVYLSGLHDWLSHNGEWPWLESIIVTPANYHLGLAKLFEETVEKPVDNRLLNLLEFDILKNVDENFRTNGFKIYSGFMSNGAIGLYALLNRPQLFNAYFISSPTLSNNFLAITSDAKNKSPQLTDKLRFLYMTIGQHNYEKSHVESVALFEQTLSILAPKELDWSVLKDDKHYYMSRPIFTVLNGIEKLFDDYHNNLAAHSEIPKRGSQAIINHYVMLSEKKYGFPVSAEGSLKNLAQSFLTTDPQKALSIYSKVVELYSESAYAYSALAAAYLKVGEVKKAIDYQTIAVKKSENMIEWHQNKLKKILADYEVKYQNKQ